MAENSKIEWTDHTFNPWIGCFKVSPGCDHCYAEARMDTRLHRVQWGAGQPRQRTKTWGDPGRWNKAHEAFYALHGRRQRVFCASLADVFDNEVPETWRIDLFSLIEQTPHLDWLLLTKRIGNAAGMLPWGPCSPAWPNVWLGATIVNQEEADRDIPKLLATPARVRFLSMEPLLGPVDLSQGGHGRLYVDELAGGQRTRLHWVIVGGESGHGARPMHPDWARSLRDQCAAAGVPFLFKQWGEWAPDEGPRPDGTDPIFDGKGPCAKLTAAGWEFSKNGFTMPLCGDTEWVYRLGKKAAGRQLDGVTHDGFPEVATRA